MVSLSRYGRLGRLRRRLPSFSNSLGFPKPAGPRSETRLAGYKLNPVIHRLFPFTMLLRPMAPPRPGPRPGAQASKSESLAESDPHPSRARPERRVSTRLLTNGLPGAPPPGERSPSTRIIFHPEFYVHNALEVLFAIG